MRTLLLALLVMITWTPVAQAQQGALITVFWDRDTNGVRDEGEPGYRNAEIAIRDDSGHETVVRTAEDGTYRLPRAGRWKVSHEEQKFVTTTPTAVESDGRDVEFGVRGAEVCGTVWLDSDFNGQIDEPETRIAGHRISVVDDPGHHATTAADGTYCVRDLPASQIRLQSEDRARIDGTAWSYTGRDYETASKFDLLTGLSPIFSIETPGSVITGYDSGFVEARGMLPTAERITVDGIGYNGVRVGDRLIAQCKYTVGGNVPDMRAATFTFPEGLKIEKAFGDPAIEDEKEEVVVEGQRVTARTKGRMPRDQKSELTVHLEVREVFAGQNITCEVQPSFYTAGGGYNGVSTFEIGVVGANGSVGSVERDSTPVWRAVLAVLLAGGAIFGVWWWRRRMRK